MNSGIPFSRPPIKLDSTFEAFLAQCSAYDLLESAIAVVDKHGVVKYANQPFMLFNKSVRDSIRNLSQYETLLECPLIRTWLSASLDISHPETIRQTFYYSPRMQIDLTICSRSISTYDNTIAGSLITLGEESIAYDNRHLAKAQDHYRKLVERIKVLDKQRLDNQHLLNVLLKEAPIPMVLFNERREIIQINQAAEVLFKINIVEARGKPCEQIFSCHNSSGVCLSKGLVTNIKNEVIKMDVSEQTLTLLRNVAILGKSGGEVMILEAFVDLSDRVAAEEERLQHEKHLEQLNLELEGKVAARTSELGEALDRAHKANANSAYLAAHDELTGLINRRRFQEEIDRWGMHYLRYKHPGLLMFIDLDNFKSINDRYGHKAGDDYLVSVSAILKQVFRSTDFVGRWGGDEFIALLPETSIESSQVIANKLINNFREIALSVAGRSMHASVSIGIAAMPDHTENISELMEFADTAMFKAKESGRGSFCIFKPSMQSG